MILLKLFFEFFCIGLFAVGGGLATVPFLTDLSIRTGWFSLDQPTNMIAISESTPGPLGVNMASYVGYEIAGIPGAILATLGLITPCLIIILIVIRCLQKFRNSQNVASIFYGLRPASTGLIAAAGWSVVCLSLIHITRPEGQFFPTAVEVSWSCLVLSAIILVLTHIKYTQKVHPVIWIALSAIAGAIFKL